MKIAHLALLAIVSLSFLGVAYSSEQVVIEFLYWDPSTHPQFCETCEPWIIAYENFLLKNQTMQMIQADYAGQVFVNWTEFYSEYGQTQKNLYGISSENSLIIKKGDEAFTIIQLAFNETYIRETIDTYLQEPPPLNKGALVCRAYNGSTEVNASVTISPNGYTNSTPFSDNFEVGNYTVNATWSGTTLAESAVIANGSITKLTFQFGLAPQNQQPHIAALLAFAFYIGFFETFSPCLIALLSFVLSYTVGKTTSFRKGLAHVMVFGVGFVSAAMAIALGIRLLLSSVTTVPTLFMTLAAIVAILFGLTMLGINPLRLLKIEHKTKPLVKKLSQKYAFTSAGLLLLGFLFYFLDPCLAPFFVASIPIYVSPATAMTTGSLLLIFLVFCIGILTPFFIIGIFAGSISKLVRMTYRHRLLLRAVSGLVLISYAMYLILFYIIP